MKTSKILLSALVGVMSVGGAVALTTDEIKARCNSSKDTVWDSFNNTCVPRNPCKKDGYATYCNKEFAEAKVGNVDLGGYLTKAYARFTDGHDADCAMLDKVGMIGQDYIGCTYDNGHYVVFEFDSLSKSGDADVILPSQLTELRGSGDYGCYGYSHDESSDHYVKYGQWIKSPILPDLCFVSGKKTDSLSDTFCSSELDYSVLAFAEVPLQMIYAGKYNMPYGTNRIQYSKEVSPDGTSVHCLTIFDE
ncbi:MAG: hypothetical protein J6S74_03050 [Alphaproteobacteria bacterium]|nr:hypothetical protein [Alphaproteobacteria bacterium]